MKSEAEAALRRILVRFGEEVLDDLPTFKAALSDFYHDEYKCQQLIFALERRIPQSLRRGDPFVVPRATSELENFGLRDVAPWVVETWARALDVEYTPVGEAGPCPGPALDYVRSRFETAQEYASRLRSMGRVLAGTARPIATRYEAHSGELPIEPSWSPWVEPLKPVRQGLLFQGSQSLARQIVKAGVPLPIHVELTAVDGIPTVLSVAMNVEERDYALQIGAARTRSRLKIPDRGAVALSPDGSLAVVGRPNGEVVVWDIRAKRARRLHAATPDVVTVVAWSPDGASIAHGHATGAVWIRRADGAGIPLQITSTQAGPPNSAVTCLSFSPDGLELVCGFGGGNAKSVIEVWNVTSGTARTLVEVDNATNSPKAAFAMTGRTLVCAAGDGLLRLFDKEYRILPLELRGDGPLAVSPDSGRLVAHVRGRLTVYEIATGEQLEPANGWMAGHGRGHGELARVAFAPGGGALVLLEPDGLTVRVLDVARGSILDQWTSRSPVRTLASSWDSLAIAFGRKNSPIDVVQFGSPFQKQPSSY